MHRRAFLGSLAALVVAPFVPTLASAPAQLCRCGRPVSAHVPFDLDATIKAAAQQLADDIDRRAFEFAMQSGVHA